MQVFIARLLLLLLLPIDSLFYLYGFIHWQTFPGMLYTLQLVVK